MSGETAQRGGAAENEVVLSGRVSGDPQTRVLPSGDSLLTFRLVVPRSRTAMTQGSKQTVDWLTCSVWTSGLRKRVSTWHDTDTVSVRGALRRRFYRGGGVASSLVEVEVLGARMLARGDGRESTRAETEPAAPP